MTLGAGCGLCAGKCLAKGRGFSEVNELNVLNAQNPTFAPHIFSKNRALMPRSPFLSTQNKLCDTYLSSS